MEKIEYTIENLEEKDTSEAFKFIKATFLTQEPILLSLGMIDYDPEKDPRINKLFTSSLSIKAVNNSGEIIGLLLADVVHRNDRRDSHIGDNIEQIRNLFSYINSQYDVFKHYPNANEIVDLKFVSVHPDYLRLGICSKMLDRVVELMKFHNLPIVFGICSSSFTADICKKSKMHLLYRLAYSDYFKDGKNPILPKLPHEAIEIYTKVMF